MNVISYNKLFVFNIYSLCELSGGLHEGLIRRYTNQLLQAVEELHKNLVVHRDIKCANIFLSNQGNCLKLGDFGSAVKIQFHNTMPGELKGYVGTQAYMVIYLTFYILLYWNSYFCLF